MRELVKAAPRLITIFGHRYLLAEPCTAGKPVLSIYQSDVVVYGANLHDYLLVEFGQGLLGLDEKQVKEIERNMRKKLNERWQDYLAIPFWGEFLGI